MSSTDFETDSPFGTAGPGGSPLQDLRTHPTEKILPLLAQACGPADSERLAAIWQSYRLPGRHLLGWLAADGPIALAGLELGSAPGPGLNPKHFQAQNPVQSPDHNPEFTPGLNPGQGRLLHLAVAPAWRGKGLGRSLLQALQDQFDLWRLDAETDKEALGFYRSCGWAWAPLARAGRFGLYWLDRERVLAPGFRFPPPRVDALRLPADPERPVGLLRLDLLHPLLQGNKWFKLKPQLLLAREHGLARIVTLGGAWSNHLLATAAAGRLLGFETIGLVRGELQDSAQAPNPVLALASQLGMRLEAVSRSRFRALRAQPGSLAKEFPQALIVPEGGASAAGVSGASEILDCLPAGTAELALACGTGTTLAGLVRAAPPELRLLGVPVLKGDFMAAELRRWLDGPPRCAWALAPGFDAGGYARVSPELARFMGELAELNPGIALEPVYTGKLAWALDTRLAGNPQIELPLMLHTGGVWPAV